MADHSETPRATVIRLLQTGMLTLRVDLGADGLGAALDSCGLSLPDQRKARDILQLKGGDQVAF